ncbi:MAG: RNA polymerase-binding protein DksA [Nitrospinota bacterium]|nr:RNA polymerase-binding protein DksA [Nitrospinota bacterium]
MSQEDHQYFKDALMEQKNALRKEAERTVDEGLGVYTEEMADTVDRSSVETDRNFTLRLRDRERKLIKKIDEALLRLDSGEFGVCEECGDDISLNRLKARPMATLCIACKESQEQGEKQSGQ